MSPQEAIATFFKECIVPGYPHAGILIESLGTRPTWLRSLRLVKTRMINACRLDNGRDLHPRLRTPMAIDLWMSAHERNLRTLLSTTPHYRNCSAAARSAERALTHQGRVHKDCIRLICNCIWDTRFKDEWNSK